MPGDPLSKQVTVLVNGDILNEANENFTVVLSSPTGVGVSLGTTVATATITNDDSLNFTISDASLTEGNAGTQNMSFDVTLAADSAAPVTVRVDTADGTSGNPAPAPGDYTATTNLVLTFNPGTSRTQQVLVPIVGDTANEPTETFLVNLTNPTGGAAITDSQGVGTIFDNDAATLFVNIDDPSITEGDLGTKELVFTVSLNQPAGPSGVTVNYSTSNNSATQPSDYLTETGSVDLRPRRDQQAHLHHDQRRFHKRSRRELLRQPLRPHRRGFRQRRQSGRRPHPQRRHPPAQYQRSLHHRG